MSLHTSSNCRFGRTRDLAETTGLSESYFEKARLNGGGPPFIRVGRAILYDIDHPMTMGGMRRLHPCKSPTPDRLHRTGQSLGKRLRGVL